MTDHNRGAYTPQSDAPLAFDARRVGGSRAPMPITLIFSALILLVLVIGGGIAILYHNGARKAGEPPQPVGEPVGAVRGPAESAATPGVQIVNPPVNGPVSAAPTFTPPPEQPAARPIETPPVATTPLPAPTTPPAAPAPAAKVEAAPPAPKVAEAAPKAPAPVAKAAPTPAPKTVAAAPAAAKTTSSAGSLVQIGAFSSPALADAGWNEVARQMPGDMAGKTKVVEKVDRPNGATLYRAMIGGFSSRAEAERLCLALLSKGKDCSVK